MRFPRQQVGDARRIADQEGVASLVRRLLAYCSRVFLWRQSWHIWRSEVGAGAAAAAGDLAGSRFEVVSRPEDLDALMKAGFCFRPPFYAEDARRMLAERKVGLMTFMDHGIASWIWATFSGRGRIYPPLKKVDYAREAYLGHALTGPRHRGMGLIVYEYNRQAEFLRENGVSVAISTTLMGNQAARRVEEKVGSRPCGRVKVVRVLMCQFWTEEWDDGR